MCLIDGHSSAQRPAPSEPRLAVRLAQGRVGNVFQGLLCEVVLKFQINDNNSCGGSPTNVITT